MTSRFKRRNSTLAVLLLVWLTSLPLLGQIPYVTEPFSRASRSEVYGVGQYLHQEDITFHGPFGPVETKMDDTGLGGLGFAFHFNDYISLHADFMFGNATFSANMPFETGQGSVHVSQDAFIHTGRVNVDYNIINRRLTPFLTAGIGYQYLETDLDRLPPVNTCWWDPWWGYICNTTHASAWETDFTWNAGVGVRWNITDNLIVKAMAGGNWLEYDHSSGITSQVEGVFSIGWSFP